MNRHLIQTYIGSLVVVFFCNAGPLFGQTWIEAVNRLPLQTESRIATRLNGFRRCTDYLPLFRSCVATDDIDACFEDFLQREVQRPMTGAEEDQRNLFHIALERLQLSDSPCVNRLFQSISNPEPNQDQLSYWQGRLDTMILELQPSRLADEEGQWLQSSDWRAVRCNAGGVSYVGRPTRSSRTNHIELPICLGIGRQSTEEDVVAACGHFDVSTRHFIEEAQVDRMRGALVSCINPSSGLMERPLANQTECGSGNLTFREHSRGRGIMQYFLNNSLTADFLAERRTHGLLNWVSSSDRTSLSRSYLRDFRDEMRRQISSRPYCREFLTESAVPREGANPSLEVLVDDFLRRHGEPVQDPTNGDATNVPVVISARPSERPHSREVQNATIQYLRSLPVHDYDRQNLCTGTCRNLVTMNCQNSRIQYISLPSFNGLNDYDSPVGAVLGPAVRELERNIDSLSRLCTSAQAVSRELPPMVTDPSCHHCRCRRAVGSCVSEAGTTVAAIFPELSCIRQGSGTIHLYTRVRLPMNLPPPLRVDNFDVAITQQLTMVRGHSGMPPTLERGSVSLISENRIYDVQCDNSRQRAGARPARPAVAINPGVACERTFPWINIRNSCPELFENRTTGENHGGGYSIEVVPGAAGAY